VGSYEYMTARAKENGVGAAAAQCVLFNPEAWWIAVLNLGLPAPIDVQVSGSKPRRQLCNSGRASRADSQNSQRRRRLHPPGSGLPGACSLMWIAPRPANWA